METPLTFVESVINWDEAFDSEGRQKRPDLAPGSASWARDQSDRIACLNFVCPCGCGHTHAVTVKEGEKVQGAWKWNGNVDKPTLEPSIQCLTPCRWHGFLTGGIFKSV